MTCDIKVKQSSVARRLPPLVVIGLLILSTLVTTQRSAYSANDQSRMAAIESIVERGTLKIDDSKLGQMSKDKVYIDGHYYSDKPMMPALIGAAVYWPMHLAGLDLEPGDNMAYFLITLLTIKAGWLLGLLAFYAALSHTGLSDRARLVLMLILGLCTLHLTWSAVFNNHSLAGSCLILGLALLIHARQARGSAWAMVGAGACFGLAAASDQPTAIFGVGFFFMICLDPALRRGAVWFALAVLAMNLPGLYINYAISGSIKPVQINPDHFDYPGSDWVDSGKLSGVKTNSLNEGLTHLYLLMFGPRGFLLYNPVLFLGLPSMAWVIIRRKTLWVEAVVGALGSIVIVLYYAFNTTGFGGWSYSIRWFVPLLPLLLFFAYPLLQVPSKPLRYLLILAVGSGLFIAALGTIDPWVRGSDESSPLVTKCQDFYYKFVD